MLDWGIAHDQAGVRYTNHDEAIGTPTYMAPEQARGGPTGGHCDVYGLGIIGYHMLAGEPPFSGTTPIEILVQHLNRAVPALAPRCPDVAYGLVDLVERMLAKPYELRPSAADIHGELERLRTGSRASNTTPTISEMRCKPFHLPNKLHRGSACAVTLVWRL